MLTYRERQWKFGTFCPFIALVPGKSAIAARTLQIQARGKLNLEGGKIVIRKLSSGKYRLYSRKTDPQTGKRRNLGTFNSRSAAEKHERAVQYFKHHA